jgi:hypothetical protein
MEDLLDELYQLTLIESGRHLTKEEQNRYLELYNILNRNNIEIPFGIEI